MRGSHVLVLLGAVLAWSAGCGMPGAGHGQEPAAHTAATPTPDQQAQLPAWQAKGATEVPPPSVLKVSTSGVQVVNQAGGQVSDAEARQWALAMLRTNQYGVWATTRLQQNFLLGSGLSDAAQRVFGPNLRLIAQAKAAGGTAIEMTPVTIRRLVLRPIPDQLKTLFTSDGFTWAQYGFYLDELGPYAAAAVTAQGARKPIDEPLPAGAAASELVGGHLASDPLLGDVWVAGSDWDCTKPTSRQAFGELCAP